MSRKILYLQGFSKMRDQSAFWDYFVKCALNKRLCINTFILISFIIDYFIFQFLIRIITSNLSFVVCSLSFINKELTDWWAEKLYIYMGSLKMRDQSSF